MVVVLKKYGKWGVYVDYTNLNDACPKDSFPLPQIDQIVNATVGHGISQTVEVYIDDIVIKSETRAEHIQYLEEAFCLMQDTT